MIFRVKQRVQGTVLDRCIGVLMGVAENEQAGQALVTAFREGLQKLGWTEGRNLKIDTRWAVRTGAESVLTGAELVQQFAKELVALEPDLILSPVNFTTAALLQETRTIPIVLAITADPVGSDFIASFPRPGGNVTGFATSEVSLSGKWLELLREIAPRVSRVAFLHNPRSRYVLERS